MEPRTAAASDVLIPQTMDVLVSMVTKARSSLIRFPFVRVDQGSKIPDVSDGAPQSIDFRQRLPSDAAASASSCVGRCVAVGFVAFIRGKEAAQPGECLTDRLDSASFAFVAPLGRTTSPTYSKAVASDWRRTGLFVQLQPAAT